MSTSSVSSSSTSSATAGLSSLSGSSSLQITGLASGLDTNQIITEEMSIYQQPVTHLQNQQSGLTAMNKQLTSIQSELKTLSSDALGVGDPTLFMTSQSVTSSDTTRVQASSATGAGVGGYQVSVSQLANSAQATYSFASPASDDPITINGSSYTINAGESIQDFVDSVNSDQTGSVYAAATNSGTVVFSSRQTGGSSSIAVNDTGGAMALQSSKPGQDAMFNVDGVDGTSSSNSVTNAIGGVTLTLTGVTTTSGPITVNVGAPAPNQTNISNAINTFVTQYNKVISDIQTQLSQPPSSTDPTQGTLYGDPGLQDLLTSMRSMMYSGGSGLPAGASTMDDIGVSTGATTGSSAESASTLAGNLQLNATTLSSMLSSNAGGVQAIMKSWSSGFVNLTDNAADPAGTIAARLTGDNSQISNLGNQITSMQSALTDKQNFLVQEFAQLEAALSSNQSQSSWLTSQIASLPGV
ncbi:MAG TPA: flagellar filament capping protein FliD [Solirubrobacteraceae bacterium]|jgi:flagellar hook-associated protein 2|nr:flagellar filament capping protein FliD [Solirubrobacteraceae bacterium]